MQAMQAGRWNIVGARTWETLELDGMNDARFGCQGSLSLSFRVSTSF